MPLFSGKSGARIYELGALALAKSEMGKLAHKLHGSCCRYELCACNGEVAGATYTHVQFNGLAPSAGRRSIHPLSNYMYHGCVCV